jgi:adenine/guanine/hypoxanthine permease
MAAVIKSFNQFKASLPVVKGDWNAFLTLVTDNLAKIVILPTILIGAFGFSPELVFGVMFPGMGITLLLGLAVFAYMATRLKAREGREDVTALPYGISTPVLFVYLFGIIGPVYFATNDAHLAYQAGLGATLIGGMVKMAGALVGPWIERTTPRAGLLGTIAGVAMVWIAVMPGAIIFSNPLIGLPALFIVLFGLLGKVQFPFRLPAGIVAMGFAVVMGFFTGDSTFNLEHVAFYTAMPVVGDLWAGLLLILSQPALLAIIIPIEIYNFIEIIGNVKTAEAAGDRYNVGTCLWVDALGTCIGALFGSAFPTTVYLGHPAYKRMGGRVSYGLMTGIFLFIASMVGLFAFLQHLIPAAGVAPLLVFIGVVMTQYAFQSTPPLHGAAVALALVPHIADLLKKQIDGVLLVVLNQGTIAPEMAISLANSQSVYLDSYRLLSNGAILIGLLWGSILAFIIDGNLRGALRFSLVALFLSLVGLIHAGQIGLAWSPMTGAYLILVIFLALMHLYQNRTEKQSLVVESPTVDNDRDRPQPIVTAKLSKP